MKVDKIKELVNNSDMPKFQKNLLIGFIERAKTEQERIREDRQLIQEVANEKNLSEVILSTDEMKIYTVRSNDEFDKKYPFRNIYKNQNGAWRKCMEASPTLDMSMLVYLQYKYLGLNSQFTNFAVKMLEIKIEE